MLIWISGFMLLHYVCLLGSNTRAKGKVNIYSGGQKQDYINANVALCQWVFKECDAHGYCSLGWCQFVLFYIQFTHTSGRGKLGSEKDDMKNRAVSQMPTWKQVSPLRQCPTLQQNKQVSIGLYGKCICSCCFMGCIFFYITQSLKLHYGLSIITRGVN